ncbi:Isopentenyldiphosphate isomerase [Streptomyces indicus]|uniref:Isopentenyldiphosphate isomerase n=2 Tax=Streptomyces indicus TaxID=417292 RepID=A0A1G8XS44_9ACTN|nr:NUDIX domain-containing protein [Streptomyces indicus]SDJ93389.1 Isopentenyldiphosphate isomerase [Streptomyces indicus]
MSSDETAGAGGEAGSGAIGEETPGASREEIIDIVDGQDRVVRQAPRSLAYRERLTHRCVFVLVRDADGRTFVHRRTPTKAVFPSFYDMFVGGVVGAGESYDVAALREAEEELGVSGLPQPTRLFKFLYEDGAGDGWSWWSTVYEVRCELPVSPQESEIDWHAFLTEEELEERLGAWPWTPDGLDAYRRLREFRA